MHKNKIRDHRFCKMARQRKWSWLTILACLIFLVVMFYIYSILSRLNYTLTPPDLPPRAVVELDDNIYLDQGWDAAGIASYQHISQGTATLPIPARWLMSLEAPSHYPVLGAFDVLGLFGTQGKFIEEYFPRLGFIESKASAQNPDGLPLGVTITPSIYFAGINRKADAVGFTCAACHTGQLVHDKKRYVIQGGQASVDLGLLRQSLAAALGQTAASSKLLHSPRFNRFAKNVLGANYNKATAYELNKELNRTISILLKESGAVDVTEGFGRIDALNRIGNQVFGYGMGRNENLTAINAPVSIPHIWTTSWFDWVQYDGSIMQPLVRNTGEALGVSAYVDSKGPIDQRFASSVNVASLVDIEESLAGKEHPTKSNSFTGLRAPQWPSEFTLPDEQLVAQGKALYESNCQGCHLPAMKEQAFWSAKEGAEGKVWQYWKKIRYDHDRETRDTYIHLNIIPLHKIGTDDAQSKVLSTRTVNTIDVGLESSVCTNGYSATGDKRLKNLPFYDSATASFALALGAFVEKTNNQWFKQSFVLDEADRAAIEGMRPNCLQAGAGYKARPLDGVWATAPFLHNGSVASIRDLLILPSERPRFVVLGGLEIDTDTVGLKQPDAVLKKLNKYASKDQYSVPDYIDGYFVLDGLERGNLNTGHAFAQPRQDGQSCNVYRRNDGLNSVQSGPLDGLLEQPKNTIGVIGQYLCDHEVDALVAYIKTL